MKKPKRGSSSSRTSKPAPKAAARAATVTGRAKRQAGRLPVRGVRRSGKGGVTSRAAAAPPAPRGDVAQIRALAITAMEAALDKKALSPVLIDVSGMASYTDFIGVVSGRSDRQVDAIAEGICQAMKARGRHILGQEGNGSGRWTLLDFGSFVIHVFYHPVREFYDLESLWIDAPRVKLDVPAEATLPQPDALYGAL